MKITKTASGKTEVRISKSEWKAIGNKMGWMKKKASDFLCRRCKNPVFQEDDIFVCDFCEEEMGLDGVIRSDSKAAIDTEDWGPGRYIDDNFGEWHDTDDPDVRAFYRQVQEESVVKRCTICGEEKALRPQYDKCDSCMRILEEGGDPY